MSVLLANRRLGARRRITGPADAHGDRPGTGWAEVVGPWPGRADEQADAPPGAGQALSPLGGEADRTWILALDPAAWPLYQLDQVIDADTGQTWVVTGADLITHNADPAVDYIRVQAHARTGAGTRP